MRVETSYVRINLREMGRPWETALDTLRRTFRAPNRSQHGSTWEETRSQILPAQPGGAPTLPPGPIRSVRRNPLLLQYVCVHPYVSNKCNAGLFFCGAWHHIRIQATQPRRFCRGWSPLPLTVTVKPAELEFQFRREAVRLHGHKRTELQDGNEMSNLLIASNSKGFCSYINDGRISIVNKWKCQSRSVLFFLVQGALVEDVFC